MSQEHISAKEMRARGYDPSSISEGERIGRLRAESMALIREIERVFKAVPRPRITLHVARGYDDEWNLSEERISELAARDPETDWREVDNEAIQSFQEYFSFSDAEGWRFYLPAFMRHDLRSFPDRGVAAYSACKSRNHVDLLSPEQLACIDRFVSLWDEYERTGPWQKG
jgi:hypothetical protein